MKFSKRLFDVIYQFSLRKHSAKVVSSGFSKAVMKIFFGQRKAQPGFHRLMRATTRRRRVREEKRAISCSEKVVRTSVAVAKTVVVAFSPRAELVGSVRLRTSSPSVR